MKTTNKVGIILAGIILGLVISPAIALSESETTKKSSTLVQTSFADSVKAVMIQGHEEPQFVPHIVHLRINDSVKFINQDGQEGGLAHDVVSVDESGMPNDVFSGYLPKVGDSFTVKFAEPGTYYYIDSIYPDMKGSIVVI